MNNAPRTYAIGLIADTHGLLRPAALAALAGVDLLIHAGDIGQPAILSDLAAIAPLVAVRGNIDTAPWAQALPETAYVQVGGVGIFVLHDRHTLAIDPAACGIRVVVSGHAHQPGIEDRDGVLWVNPGSAGPRRFRLPVSLARLTIQGGEVVVQLVPLT